MQIFLKRDIDLPDVVYFQEPAYGFVKKVTASTNRDEDDYSTTIAYRHFMFLGVSEISRVCIAIQRT